MKKITVLFFLLCVGVGFAQKKPKIKGNKNETEVSKALDGFTTVEIRDDLEVTISKSSDDEYHMKTDENLVDVVIFEVVDSILSIYTTHEISSSSDVEIQLSYVHLKEMRLRNKAKVISRDIERFDEFLMKTYDDSKYDLNVLLDKGTFEMSGSSSGKLVLRGTEAFFALRDNSEVKGSVVLDQGTTEIVDKAEMDLTGDIEDLKITTTGSGSMDVKDLKTTTVDISASENSDIQVYANKKLKVFAKGKSKIYIYGEPEIEIVGFRDKSELIKR